MCLFLSSTKNCFMIKAINNLPFKILFSFLLFFELQIHLPKILFYLLDWFSFGNDLKKLLSTIIISISLILCYMLLRKIFKFGGPLSSLGKYVYQVFIGLMIGFILLSFSMFFVWLIGDFSILSINPVSLLIPHLIISISSSISEEILHRGIIFNLIEDKFGSYIAIIISSLNFGLFHIANPNSSLLLSLCLSINAGFLLASAYIYSRSIVFPVSIHFSWNFFSSSIFGSNVSGYKIEESFFVTNISGPEYITGGEFGIEGSIQVLIINLIASFIFFYISRKKLSFIFKENR